MERYECTEFIDAFVIPFSEGCTFTVISDECECTSRLHETTQLGWQDNLCRGRRKWELEFGFTVFKKTSPSAAAVALCCFCDILDDEPSWMFSDESLLPTELWRLSRYNYIFLRSSVAQLQLLNVPVQGHVSALRSSSLPNLCNSFYLRSYFVKCGIGS